MVPLYTLFLTSLGGLKWLLAGRAARAERAYTDGALRVEEVSRLFQVKPGNAAAGDTLTVAKRQYELGRLVLLRDALEVAYHGWQARADRAAKLQARLAGWKGRLVPYLFGVADVAIALTALHYLGLPHGLNASALTEWVRGFMT
ncbi:hypothetical protein [Fimbriiglobus ruber]|uniref:Uncharacterized protein n=1 Tax=Fimbriiglobus ruber TaxID=1908690 RepID=A0A225DZ31_9BACT|nr:hypothetical protein [Fimbriiglobus ruber]OWK43788.1 hypothetical protein FRUB_03387 [Fimbriiglobus ruber]